MKKLIIFLLSCISVYCYGHTSNLNNRIQCQVIGISDGDTFTCLIKKREKIKVRLQAIDAPEKGQAFGHKAYQTLSALIAKQTVYLELNGYDRYHRTIATAYDFQGQNINLLMIKKGMAWAYRQYKPPQSYLAAEQQARRQSLGLWRDKKPIEPQLWRKK